MLVFLVINIDNYCIARRSEKNMFIARDYYVKLVGDKALIL